MSWLMVMVGSVWIRAAVAISASVLLLNGIVQSSGSPNSYKFSIAHRSRRVPGFVCASSPNNNHCADRTKKQSHRRHSRGETKLLDNNNPENNNEFMGGGGGGGGSGTWNPFSLAVLKLGFTEPAWTSPLNYKKANGTYICANCKSPLFSSSGKYDSGSGWPSFWKTIDNNRVALERNWDGRIECKCATCDGHLGHIFPDGPMRGSLDVNELQTVPESDPKLGYKVQRGIMNDDDNDDQSKYSRMPRFCINGIALRFEEAK